jgi:DNA-binding NtrC family response regulator
VDRLGGGAPVKVDVRLLAATNRDLSAEVRSGRFREDLFFRLNVIGLAIPPLRARPGDIPALARYFADRFSAANGLPRRALTPAAEALLLQHPWPGNVRELENALHRAVLLAEGAQIGPEAIELSVPPREVVMAEIPAGASATPPPSALVSGLVGRRVEEVERDLILETLTHCLGNRTRAAEILGISIRTLRNKLHEYRAQGVAVAVQPGFLLPGGR